MNSWEPFVRRASGQLMMIQQVGYDGLSRGSWLGFGEGPAAIGAHAKVDEDMLSRHTCGVDTQGPEWPAFLARHRQRVGRFDELDGEDLQAAVQAEPDELVAKLVCDQVIRDVEGMFSQLVTLNDGHFAGLRDRAEWFAPVLAGDAMVFEVCACNGWFSAPPLFLRAASRGDALHEIFHAASHQALRARALTILTRRYIRAPAALPTDVTACERMLQGLGPDALAEALDYAYAKGDAPTSFSVVEAEVPEVLRGAAADAMVA